MFGFSCSQYGSDLIGSSCPESLTVGPVAHLSQAKGPAQLAAYCRPIISPVSDHFLLDKGPMPVCATTRHTAGALEGHDNNSKMK